MRAVFAAVVAAVVLVAAVNLPSAAGGPTGYLAPVSACPGSARLSADRATHRRALVCLVNWARRRAGLAPLREDAALSQAADAKAGAIVACREFSHSPCGRGSTAATTAAGYDYRVWAEDLYWGSGALATPRAALRAWLLSPPHRENLFLASVRDLGVGRVRVDSFSGATGVAVWVLQVGRR